MSTTTTNNAATFTTARRTLNAALMRLSATVPTRSPKEILQNVALSVADVLTVSGTDCDTQHAETLGGVIVGDEATQHAPPVLVNLAELRKATTGTGGDITIETTPTGRVKIDGLQLAPQPEPVEFPAITHAAAVPTTGAAYVRAAELATMLKRVAFCCDNESGRFALGGAMLELAAADDTGTVGTFARFIGTDGRRLSVDATDGAEPAELASAIVPLSVVKTCIKAAGAASTVFIETLRNPPHATAAASDSETEPTETEPTETEPTETRPAAVDDRADSVRLTFIDSDGAPSSIITARCMEGRFPNWRQVVPAELSELAEFQAAELLPLARRAKLTTGDYSRGVRIGTRPDRLVIVNRNNETGQKYGGGVLAMTRNRREFRAGSATIDVSFLVDVLAAVGETVCTWETSAKPAGLSEPGSKVSSSPLVLTVPGSRFRHVIMPMSHNRPNRKPATKPATPETDSE